MYRSLLYLIIFIGFASGCNKNTPDEPTLLDIPYNPEPYELVVPEHFPKMSIPINNPMTKEGVKLGRRLFYDPILSSDNTMGCFSCHLPEGNFTDNTRFSEGVTGDLGSRSSMSLLNIGFNNNGFFWDGREMTLEDQALIPVEDSVELHNMWPDVTLEIQMDDDYPGLFREAFGITKATDISKEFVVKALAQFERSLVSSGQSKYDRVISGEDVFTDEELLGHNIFFDIEPDISRHAECGHCHNAPLFTTNEYFNNGIDDVDNGILSDLGRGAVTGDVFDNGKFRVPTLRNIMESGPYMHDGRFSTLDEVIDHYDSHIKSSRNLDPNLRTLDLSDEDRAALKAFILTLEDPVFLSDTRYQSPF